MTEYWVSKSKFWCKFCKVWMTDNKASRAKHDNGRGHKENVQNFFKETREKKRAEAREKEEIDKEMREIERKARQQFATDVESGQAKFSYQPRYGGPVGGPPGPSGAPPPPPDRPAGAPPPPPPRTGAEWESVIPPPPPKRQRTAEDKALADELAKEGIILDQEEGEDDAPEMEVVYGGHDIFWEYKPAKEAKAQGDIKADIDAEGEAGVKVESDDPGADIKSGGEVTEKKEKRSKWDIKPEEDVKPEEGAKPEEDVKPDGDVKPEGDVKPGEAADAEPDSGDQTFGPYTGSQMAGWAAQGYFSSGAGALLRRVSPDGVEKLSDFVATADKDSNELINLLTGIDGGGVHLANDEGAQEGVEAEQGQQAQGVQAQAAGVIGKWETVRIVNT